MARTLEPFLKAFFFFLLLVESDYKTEPGKISNAVIGKDGKLEMVEMMMMIALF